MKKITGLIRSKKFPLALWLIIFAALAASFSVSLLISPEIKFSSSLFDILPPSSNLKDVQEADTELGLKTGRAVTILCADESFEKARNSAALFYDRYSGTDYFDELALYSGDDSIKEITDWLYKWRFNLLDSETTAMLNSGNAESVAQEALAAVYGAFTMTDLSVLERDPFMLTERALNRFLNSPALKSTAMAPKDDVLAANHDGKWYVLIRGTVSEKGASLTNKNSAVKSIYEYCDEQTKTAGTEFIFSGVPFHSYESSSGAQTEISVISTVSLILIVIAFIFMFRNILPAVISAAAVIFACGTGLTAVLLFFRGIHILTFVFGTTLIGTCLDYSIHYFINWKGNTEKKSGAEIRSHILKGVGLGFISTEICFAVLFLAPFPLLKQVSVFLSAGLAAAFLTVMCIYPYIRLPKNRAIRFITDTKPGKLTSILSKKPLRLSVIIITSVLSVAVILIRHTDLKIHNNIAGLYSISDRMLKNEMTSAKVLNTGSSGWYYILRADSQENLLKEGEKFDSVLAAAVKDGKLGNYLSMTQFISSEESQKNSYNASANLLRIAENQYATLGYPSSYSESYQKEYAEADGKHFSIDSGLPYAIQSAISNLYIGKIDGEYYSCVMPLHATDEAFFRELAERNENIFFINKTKDISSQLDVLSATMILLLAVSYAAVIVILAFCYPLKNVIKIGIIPVYSLAVTTAVLLLCRIPIGFFPVTSFVLIFGLGLDYIIYSVEGSKADSLLTKKLNNAAILLSFITTAFSFGALAVTSFPPVHMLGTAVFAGLSAAVAGSFCLSNPEKRH